MNHIYLSFGLVVYSIILFIILRKKSNFLKTFAMIIGSCGDMALAHYWIFEKSIFVYGAGLFALSHIFYIFAFLSEVKKKVFNKGFWVGTIFSCLIIISLIIIYFLNPQNEFMVPIIYGLIIGFLLSCVCGFAYIRKDFVGLINVIGIVSFVISDYLIGINIVGGIDFEMRGDLIWIFYPIGQFLLIFDWRKNEL